MFRLTPVVKNLLIINVAVFIAIQLFSWLGDNVGMYNFYSVHFKPYQIFTYMFSHFGFLHLAMNMLGLVVFGPTIEMIWGAKKFTIFFVVAGIGGGLFYAGSEYARTYQFRSDLETYSMEASPQNFSSLITDHRKEFGSVYNIIDLYDFRTKFEENPESRKQESIYYVETVRNRLITNNKVPMIGASGAIFGILCVFGLLFPERQLMLIFPPIPIRAKYLILGISAYTIVMAVMEFGGMYNDSVAHGAHLGGLIIGYIAVKFF